MDDIQFRSDLYSEAAQHYEHYRPDYPQRLLDELVERTDLTGRGRLLDLACGTGQVTFGLARHFEQVWAVDQEPEMLRVGRSKAELSGIGNIRWIDSAAENLEAALQSFELITVGNAFHRLAREAVAAKALAWLKPGGHLALLWGGTPWRGSAAWQVAMCEVLERWMDLAATRDRIPGGWESARSARPDMEVVRAAGFEVLGRSTESVVREWALDHLVGFVYSTSFLPKAALGERVVDFEEDLRRHLAEAAGREPYVQQTEFALELARRPHDHQPASLETSEIAEGTEFQKTRQNVLAAAKMRRRPVHARGHDGLDKRRYARWAT